MGSVKDTQLLKQYAVYGMNAFCLKRTYSSFCAMSFHNFIRMEIESVNESIQDFQQVCEAVPTGTWFSVHAAQVS
jgi:hypothetical protein